MDLDQADPMYRQFRQIFEAFKVSLCQQRLPIALKVFDHQKGGLFLYSPCSPFQYEGIVLGVQQIKLWGLNSC